MYVRGTGGIVSLSKSLTVKQLNSTGNMAVVLVAMGLYGSVYLGWQLRLSDDTATVIKARDLHPKLATGMTIFFALGALGGIMSLIMQGKPIFSRCARRTMPIAPLPPHLAGVAYLLTL
jgi:hypothetical protein